LHRCYTRALISFSSRECQHADEIFGNDRHGSLATIDALDQLRKEPELEWSYLSPSAELKPGQRTGKFRLGNDQLLVDATGKSQISVQDYAVAMIDELERPAHVRRRFTVGY
jgi:uncharacterized protein